VGYESLAQRSRARRRPRLRQGCAAKYPPSKVARRHHLGAARYVGTGLACATVGVAGAAGQDTIGSIPALCCRRYTSSVAGGNDGGEAAS